MRNKKYEKYRILVAFNLYTDVAKKIDVPPTALTYFMEEGTETKKRQNSQGASRKLNIY